MDHTQDMRGASTPPPRTPQGAPRFLPGTILDKRFRIVAPLGRGGMGEVYRADDLKLGVPVALKFLSRELENDPARLAMLLDEVKLARHVSHPNVCRVWDVGETDGAHYVAMEYVDGEDLASLLRRIGRLPEERGVQIARELCAGLAAIHDQGVLHRDLKPSNVMIDGRGRVRIADFGLAALSDTLTPDAMRSGTPAYMAPEQLDGRDVTVRSDLYALGLVLYELFTGRRAFESALRASDTRITTPASHVRTLDSLVESAIMRCLETDPTMRPASALHVSSALPGGDPVMAALAAGETPSPEMVAASGGAGGLKWFAALGVVLCIAAGLMATLILSERRGLPFTSDDKPYAVLRDRATEFVRTLGLARDGDAVRGGLMRAAPAAGADSLCMWYRRSPLPIPNVIEERSLQGYPVFHLPALETPGELSLRLDLRGRLIEFRHVPAAGTDSLARTSPDYRPFFEAAGLNATAARPASPRAPFLPSDTCAAWTIPAREGAQRVDASAYRGRVTFFVVGSPAVIPTPSHTQMIVATLISLMPLVLGLVLLVYARRNLLAGRADVNGATRLSILTFVLGWLGFGLFAVPTTAWPGSLMMIGLLISGFFAVLQGTAYVALEPIVRRGHPDWLVSWTRALNGRLRDRLVGRDVLLGVLGGVLMVVLGEASGLYFHTTPYGDYQAAGIGGRIAVAVILRALNIGMLSPMLAILWLALLSQATGRRKWIAWALWMGISTVFWNLSAPLGHWWISLLKVAVLACVLARFGLLGMVAANVTYAMLNEEYLTTHVGAWYASVTVTALVVIGAIVTWTAFTATQTQRRAT